MRFVFVALLIVHGRVQSAIWAAPRSKDQKAPFGPGHSWLLGERRIFAVVLALVATVLVWLDWPAQTTLGT